MKLEMAGQRELNSTQSPRVRRISEHNRKYKGTDDSPYHLAGQIHSVVLAVIQFQDSRRPGLEKLLLLVIRTDRD